MANTTAVYARIDSDLKDSAEGILAQLGISPSGAIQMLYSQIVLKGGMPFDLRLPANKPVAVEILSKTQLDAALNAGVQAVAEGNVYTADEVDAILDRRVGI